MLILESFKDLSTSKGPMRVYWFAPSLPGWAPGRGKFAGIVVWSEIYQVTEPIKRFCRMVAGQGYLVAAAEIYHEFEQPGTPFAYDDEGTDKGNRYKIEKDLNQYDEDRKLVLDAMDAHPQCNGSIGVAGICIGGHLAYRSCFDPRVRAGALIEPTDIHIQGLGKGKKDDSLARMGEIKAELVMIFGHGDNHIPADGRTLIRTALHKHKVPHTFVELHNVQHAFIRDELSKGRYDPAMAQAAFGIIWECFSRRLRVEWDVEMSERAKSGSRASL